MLADKDTRQHFYYLRLVGDLKICCGIASLRSQ